VNVLLTVGTGVQFDRLLRAADAWAARHPEHAVTMQIGYSDYQPAHAAEFFRFMPFAEFQKRFDAADVAVAHGSAGPILGARRRGLPLVLVPRQKQYGEMSNDHQVEICEAIRGESALHETVLDAGGLGAAIDRAIEKRRGGLAYEPHLLKDRLVATIAAFVQSQGALPGESAARD